MRREFTEQDRTKQGSTASAQTCARATIGIDLPTVDDFSKIEQLSPVALAYIGDAVYELYIRTYYLMPPMRVADYHNRVVAQVRAETQAVYVEMLQPHFTASEKEILRRGRNAAGGKPRRLSGKIYQQATSLETLIGYLYLTDPQRLYELLTKLELK
ncbi:ribonuclease III [Pleurocapsales cyanobacterium LEGE 06147]|nr:ribonuclease III [Pleurocapsales cyanobacterium LEGE 06147]